MMCPSVSFDILQNMIPNRNGDSANRKQIHTLTHSDSIQSHTISRHTNISKNQKKKKQHSAKSNAMWKNSTKNRSMSAVIK